MAYEYAGPVIPTRPFVFAVPDLGPVWIWASNLSEARARLRRVLLRSGLPADTAGPLSREAGARAA